MKGCHEPMDFSGFKHFHTGTFGIMSCKFRYFDAKIFNIKSVGMSESSTTRFAFLTFGIHPLVYPSC